MLTTGFESGKAREVFGLPDRPRMTETLPQRGYARAAASGADQLSSIMNVSMSTVRRQKSAPSKSAKLSERQIHLIAKALSDPRRHEILQHVGTREAGVLCGEVRGRQPVTAATLSHHIKELENAGLVQVEREGKCMRLILQRDILEAYLDHLRAI